MLSANSAQRTRLSLAFAAVLLLVVSVAAQDAPSDWRDYTSAAQRSAPERIRLLETFLSAYPRSSLQHDAVALLAWSYLANGNFVSAGNAANQLLATDPTNIIALAIRTEQLRHAENDKHSTDELRQTTDRALGAYQGFRLPAGISALEAYAIQRRTLAMLEGARGFAAWRQKDYATAQSYLRQATAIEPDSGEDVYTLALADLASGPEFQREGFLLLARAVKLAQRTPEAAQIAAYGRRQYLDSGGTEEGWNGYLAAAGAAPAVSATVTTAAITPPAAKPNEGRASTPIPGERPTPSTAAVTTSRPKTSHEEVAKKRKPDPDVDIPPEWRSPPGLDEAVVRKPNLSTIGPVSLGIVIESADAHASHNAIVHGLVDMLGYLRPGDEAFILAYGKDVDFVQDITAMPRLLEDALVDMKPQGGAALFDALGVAAGHLARIAKNPNRVLLVVSDGSNTSRPEAAYKLEANLGEVRVFCIGVGVSGEGQRVLQTLAGRTGGVASFVANPAQFATVSDAIAHSIYSGGL